jgi:hypothetical protein
VTFAVLALCGGVVALLAGPPLSLVNKSRPGAR